MSSRRKPKQDPNPLGPVAEGFADDVTRVCVDALRPILSRLVRSALAKLRIGPCNCCGVIVQWRGEDYDEMCQHCFSSMEQHMAAIRAAELAVRQPTDASLQEPKP